MSPPSSNPLSQPVTSSCDNKQQNFLLVLEPEPLETAASRVVTPPGTRPHLARSIQSPCDLVAAHPATLITTFRGNLRPQAICQRLEETGRRSNQLGLNLEENESSETVLFCCAGRQQQQAVAAVVVRKSSRNKH